MHSDVKQAHTDTQTHTLTPTHTLTSTHTNTQAHTHSQTLAHTHANTNTHITHAHTNTQSLTYTDIYMVLQASVLSHVDIIAADVLMLWSSEYCRRPCCALTHSQGAATNYVLMGWPR